MNTSNPPPISSASWPTGVGLAEFVEIDSTNEEAKRRAEAGGAAEAGEQGPIWLRSDMQTAGRGRRGRTWVSPGGNLFATLLIRPEITPSQAALLSFAAALSVADLLDAFVEPSRVKLKWPNDVQLDGGKVCGVLLESSATSGGLVDWLAVGVGVNLANHPGLEEPRTIALADAMDSPAPTPQEALTHLAAAFARHYEAFQTHGFEAVRGPWLARARGMGEPMVARLPHEEIRGIFTGIDETGALLLETNGALRKITAGEVFFGG